MPAARCKQVGTEVTKDLDIRGRLERSTGEPIHWEEVIVWLGMKGESMKGSDVHKQGWDVQAFCGKS